MSVVLIVEDEAKMRMITLSSIISVPSQLVARDFAKDVLSKGGAFICKVLQGGATGELLKLLKRDFAEVKHVKPPASRSDSAEIYVVALGFRG